MVACAVCGQAVHTCERAEPVDHDYRCPVHPDGVELGAGGPWACSSECSEAWEERQRPRLEVRHPHDLLEHSIQAGVIRGYRRAFKHVDQPTEEQIVEAVVRAVLEDVDESFRVGDEPR